MHETWICFIISLEYDEDLMIIHITIEHIESENSQWTVILLGRSWRARNFVQLDIISTIHLLRGTFDSWTRIK